MTIVDPQSQPFVLHETHGAKAYITLNRPDRHNAFGPGEQEQIQRAFAGIDSDEDVKVIIFRGNGASFSTGFDVGQTAAERDEPRSRRRPTQRSYLQSDLAVWADRASAFHSSKVVIAEGKGYVLGGALHYFFSSDILIAAEGTVFGNPPARTIGAGVGMLTMLKLGIAIANEMQFLGRYFSAEQLLARGALNRVVPRGSLEETVEAAADLVCEVPGDGLAAAKLANRVAWTVLGQEASTLVQAMAHTLQVQQRLSDSERDFLRERTAHGATTALQGRDERWKELMQRYAPEG